MNTRRWLIIELNRGTMKFIAILDGTNSEMMWSYTLESITEMVKLASHRGFWRVYRLVEITG